MVSLFGNRWRVNEELRFEKRWRIVYKINKEEEKVEVIAIWHKDDF